MTHTFDAGTIQGIASSLPAGAVPTPIQRFSWPLKLTTITKKFELESSYRERICTVTFL